MDDKISKSTKSQFDYCTTSASFTCVGSHTSIRKLNWLPFSSLIKSLTFPFKHWKHPISLSLFSDAVPTAHTNLVSFSSLFNLCVALMARAQDGQTMHLLDFVPARVRTKPCKNNKNEHGNHLFLTNINLSL